MTPSSGTSPVAFYWEVPPPPGTPQDIEFWKSLLNAAAIQNYEAVLDIPKTVDEGVIPPVIMYHRKCRSLFTMKRELEKISRDNCEAENQLTQERKLISRQSPGVSRIYANVCIFCEKVAKYKKGSRSRGLLFNVVTSELMIPEERLLMLRGRPSDLRGGREGGGSYQKKIVQGKLVRKKIVQKCNHYEKCQHWPKKDLAAPKLPKTKILHKNIVHPPPR